jgi:hypothetical protein
LNLQKYQDKEVRVKFQGGREGEFGALICFVPGDLERTFLGERQVGFEAVRSVVAG